MPIKTDINAKGFVGKYKSFWNYVNNDSHGWYSDTCCGQAAVFSVFKTVKANADYRGGFEMFVKTFPPDNFGGKLGSSSKRVTEMLGAFGFRVRQASGEGPLRSALVNGPAIVCLDVGAAGWKSWGLHWVAVFGYTDAGGGYYYVSAWDHSSFPTRPQFKSGWNTGLTSILSHTSNTCYIPY